MKFVVLLALVGLASCRTALVGGDRARDVKIEYTYLDDNGKEVKVEVNADKLGLDLSRDDSSVTLKKAARPSISSPRRVKVDDFERPETRTRFVHVQREIEPVVQQQFVQVQSQPAPRPEFETRFVQVQAQPAPRPVAEPRFVQVQPQPAPRPQAETRFVQVKPATPSVRFVEADDFEVPEPKTQVRFVQVKQESRPVVQTRFVQVEAQRPEIETKFVKVEVPEPEFETRFVQVPAAQRQELVTRFVQAKPAPASSPVRRTQFVEVERQPLQAVRPTAFQPQHAAIPSASHFQVPRTSHSRHTSGRQSFSSSDDDNSAEK